MFNAEWTTAGASERDSSCAEGRFDAVDDGAAMLPPGDDGCLLLRALGTVKIECGLVIDKSLSAFVALASGHSGRPLEHEFDSAYLPCIVRSTPCLR